MLAVSFLLIITGFLLIYAGIRGKSLKTELLRVFGGS